MDTTYLKANRHDQGEQALRQMELALAILDQADGLGEVGVHLDLAVHRLKSVLATSDEDIRLLGSR